MGAGLESYQLAVTGCVAASKSLFQYLSWDSFVCKEVKD